MSGCSPGFLLQFLKFFPRLNDRSDRFTHKGFLACLHKDVEEPCNLGLHFPLSLLRFDLKNCAPLLDPVSFLCLPFNEPELRHIHADSGYHHLHNHFKFSPYSSVFLTAATIFSTCGKCAFSRGAEYGTAVFKAATRMIGASSKSKYFSETTAATSEPMPPRLRPSSTITKRLVFFMDVAMSSSSRGMMVLRSITSALIPSFSSLPAASRER